MSKMDDMRKVYDAQSKIVPQEPVDDGRVVLEQNEEESKIINDKPKINHNIKLAERILKLNPNLPPAYKSKFELMSKNAHFATNVCVVIDDALNNGIKLLLSEELV